MTCTPVFFPGSWDAIVLPASVFFSLPQLRWDSPTIDLMVYGPSHLLRKAWLSGARDYLKEPWQPEELFLRLRGPMPFSLKWSWGDGTLYLQGTQLHSEQDLPMVHLTQTEADLLRVLVQRQGQVVSRAVLSWAAQCSEGRVVDTLLARLRKKIQAVVRFDDDPLPSIRGLGYRLP